MAGEIPEGGLSRAEILSHHLLPPDTITANKAGFCFDLPRRKYSFPKQGQQCGSLDRSWPEEAAQMVRAPALGASSWARVGDRMEEG